MWRQRSSKNFQHLLHLNDMIDFQVGRFARTPVSRMGEDVPQNQMELAECAGKKVNGRLVRWLSPVNLADALMFVVNRLK